jgi:hypothetical protein
MPRCGAEFRIMRDPANTTMNINVVTPNGNQAVIGAIILQVRRGEWHPIEIVGDTVIIHTETILSYPQLSLVVRWPPQGEGSSTALFLPNSSTASPQALAGLATMLGIGASQISTYVSSYPNASSSGISTAWTAYSCLLGDELPDGTKLTEAIMTQRDGTPTRGGWVFTEPDNSQGNSSPGTPGGGSENGTWLVLPANRFAIIGGKLGALFGTGRRLYFESGVDDAFRARVRSEFGFGAGDGEDAYIRVQDFGYDFLLEVTPQ